MWLQGHGGTRSVTSDPEAPVDLVAAGSPSATKPGAMFEVMGKYAVFAARFGATDETVATTVLSPLESMSTTDLDRVRVAIVAGELVGADAALKRLSQISVDKADEGVVTDVNELGELYSGAELGESQRDRLIARHAWFGKLAASFGLPDEDPLRAEVLAGANRVGKIFLFGLGGAGVVAFIGLGLFITAIILFATGAMRTRYVPPAPGGSTGIETFALFLSAFLIVQIVIGSLQALIGDAAGIVGSVLIWSLLLVPLWPLMRGATWSELRQSLGWHRGAGVVREIGSGVVGYVAGLPIVAAGVGITLLIMQLVALFSGSEPAPPSHPLPDELGSGGILAAIQLVLMATVWAPVVEESIFRGALFNHLRGTLHPIVAGLIVAFIFAAIHPQGLIAIPALMSLGFVFCLLREWRGSLIASMVAHGLNNGMVVTLLLILFKG